MTPKPKKCKCGCGATFTPRSSLQIAATLECAYRITMKRREKAEKEAKKEERKKARQVKERLKTRRDYLKEAQIAFNAFIRERDKDKPCICCGKPLSSGEIGGGFDCGHYRSVGSAPHVRFNEHNAHGQRKQCNRWGSGRAVDYRIGLIGRIGLEAVEALEADQTVKKWSIDELKAIAAHYRAMLKELRR